MGNAPASMPATIVPSVVATCWSTAGVMDETRRRLKALGLTWQEPVTLWDVDVPADLERLRANGLQHLLPDCEG